MPRLTPAEALAKLPGPEGKRFVTLFEHGSLLVEIYAPRGRDPQQPHTRDEVYFVIAGHGTFVEGDRRYPFAPGDFLFVRAGVIHRFEDFNDDLAVWVLFYGPRAARSPKRAPQFDNYPRDQRPQVAATVQPFFAS